MKDKDKKYIMLGVIVTLGFALIPFIMDTEQSFWVYFLFLSFCYIVMTQGWNLVAGYTGQISLGQHAFFGIGAYTTAIIWYYGVLGLEWYYFNPLLMIFSGVIAAIFAVAIGLPLLSKLHGDYFALGTLGLGEIIKVLFIKGGDLTKGPAGILLPSGIYTSLKPHYWTALFLAFFATLVVYYMSRSKIGLALVAIREDEMAAEAKGINCLKYKIFVFAVNAFLVGMCGSLFAYYLFHVSPEGFLVLKWTLYPILMCVMGGSGTIIGPIIGAFVMNGVFSLASIYFPNIHPILTGIIIIFVMLFMPKGLVSLGRK